MTVDKEKVEKKKMGVNDAAISYLYRGNRTIWEVKSYLERREYSKEEIDQALEFLEEHNYVDDVEYCKWYLDKYIEKGRGLGRIKEELRTKKGVDPEIIKAVMEEYAYPENETRRAFLQAEKILDGRPLTKHTIPRIGRRLFYLGYDINTIMHVVHEYEKKKRKEDAESGR